MVDEYGSSVDVSYKLWIKSSSGEYGNNIFYPIPSHTTHEEFISWLLKEIKVTLKDEKSFILCFQRFNFDGPSYKILEKEIKLNPHKLELGYYEFI